MSNNDNSSSSSSQPPPQQMTDSSALPPFPSLVSPPSRPSMQSRLPLLHTPTHTTDTTSIARIDDADTIIQLAPIHPVPSHSSSSCTASDVDLPESCDSDLLTSSTSSSHTLAVATEAELRDKFKERQSREREPKRKRSARKQKSSDSSVAMTEPSALQKNDSTFSHSFAAINSSETPRSASFRASRTSLNSGEDGSASDRAEAEEASMDIGGAFASDSILRRPLDGLRRQRMRISKGLSNLSPACIFGALRRKLPIASWLPHYQLREMLLRDFLGGAMLAIVIVPQGMAYGILAGLPPIYGLYSSILPPIIYMLFGRSKEMHVGPFALVSLLVATSVAALTPTDAPVQMQVDTACVLSLLVGATLIAMSFLRLGFAVNFLADCVLSAFTCASAVLILTSQWKSFLGLTGMPGQLSCIDTYIYIFSHLGSINGWSTGLGVLTLLLLLSIDHLNARYKLKIPVPSQLVVVIVGTSICAAGGLNTSPYNISVVGTIPSGLPHFSFPGVGPYDIYRTRVLNGTTVSYTRTYPSLWQWSSIQRFISPMCMLALIAYIVSISITKTFAAKRAEEADKKNREKEKAARDAAAAATATTAAVQPADSADTTIDVSIHDDSAAAATAPSQPHTSTSQSTSEPANSPTQHTALLQNETRFPSPSPSPSSSPPVPSASLSSPSPSPAPLSSSSSLPSSPSKTDHKSDVVVIDANEEMFALGMANFCGGFLQCFPAAGSLSRSALVYNANAATPLHNLISVILLGFVLLFMTPALYYLPKTTLAAIIFVALQSLLKQVSELPRLWRVRPTDGLMWLVTFVATIVFGTEGGIAIGLVTSLLMLLKQTTRPPVAILGRLDGTDIYRNIARFPQARTFRSILIFRFDAPLHFANKDYFLEKLRLAIARQEERQWRLSKEGVAAEEKSHMRSARATAMRRRRTTAAIERGIAGTKQTLKGIHGAVSHTAKTLMGRIVNSSSGDTLERKQRSEEERKDEVLQPPPSSSTTAATAAVNAATDADAAAQNLNPFLTNDNAAASASPFAASSSPTAPSSPTPAHMHDPLNWELSSETDVTRPPTATAASTAPKFSEIQWDELRPIQHASEANIRSSVQTDRGSSSNNNSVDMDASNNSVSANGPTASGALPSSSPLTAARSSRPRPRSAFRIQYVILDCGSLIDIDDAALKMLSGLESQLKVTIVFAGMKAPVRDLLNRVRFFDSDRSSSNGSASDPRLLPVEPLFVTVHQAVRYLLKRQREQEAIEEAEEAVALHALQTHSAAIGSSVDGRT